MSPYKSGKEPLSQTSFDFDGTKYLEMLSNWENKYEDICHSKLCCIEFQRGEAMCTINFLKYSTLEFKGTLRPRYSRVFIYSISTQSFPNSPVTNEYIICAHRRQNIFALKLIVHPCKIRCNTICYDKCLHIYFPNWKAFPNTWRR